MVDEGVFVVGLFVNTAGKRVSGILEHGLEIVLDPAPQLGLPLVVGLDSGEGDDISGGGQEAGWHAVGNTPHVDYNQSIHDPVMSLSFLCLSAVSVSFQPGKIYCN